ncbi:expressed unknown protein [Seminavis robusta]|uniref:WH2 domain-containing protein n=1 Tax=Seminavis robusta TaxID=568900 RepID=A0A9N8EZ12_9STRA|nr:expressed unknown protein [Seminavis robusta]|eukprot:Sro2194_g318520.1 n/a (628) ;mRNA; f:10884-12767
MKRHPSNRRISAVAISRGSSRRLMEETSGLRRCNTTTTATVVKTNHNSVTPHPTDIVDRAESVRGWVVGFLGRKLTLEEDELLQDDCAKFVSSNDSDQAAVKRVIQTLLGAYFFQAANGGTEDDENALPKSRANSIHLEAEAGIVETMAVTKIQASARGFMTRQSYASQLQEAKAKRISETKLKASRISDLTRTDSQELQEELQTVEPTVQVDAATLIQSMVRGHVSRQHNEYWQHKQIQKIAITNNNQTTTKDQEEPVGCAPVVVVAKEPSATTTPPPTKTRASVKTNRPSVSLAAITETAEVTFPTEENDANKPAILEDQPTKPMEDSSRTTNARGMILLNESSDELSSVTDMVKINIVIKVQALIRSFLVRRRRRRLRKAKSIRMLKCRPSLIFTVKGTPAEQTAATDIQRTLRGYVQRWKYWTAMRQQQLDEIQSLRAKQLRKIEERKKIMLKTTKKQLFFDATSLARQLQRAKRAIKFLVKEEKRAIQQNDRLSREIFELKKANQWLTNSNDTATCSNDTLQAEINLLQARKDKLKAAKTERQSTVQQLTVEWKRVSKETQLEKQRKEEIQACIAQIKERAADFFKEYNPNLEEEILESVKATIKTENSSNNAPKSNGIQVN